MRVVVRIAILVLVLALVAPAHAMADDAPASSQSSASLRDVAGTTSDVLLVATMVQAAAIDSLLVPLVRGEPELAWRASLAHSLALGLTVSIGALFEAAQGAPYSLKSGVAFTSAGLSCAIHLSRRIHDEPVADFAACGASVAMATASGLFGILAEGQDFGDVLVGGAFGLLVGYVTPLALMPERPRHDARAELEAAIEADILADDARDLRARSSRGERSWSAAPMLSTPTSELAPSYETSQRGGSAGAQVGPGTTGAGSGGALGSAVGVSISATF